MRVRLPPPALPSDSERLRAGVAKQADALGLNPSGHSPCGFDSHRPHRWVPDDTHHASLAQLVERRTFNPGVLSSSLRGRTAASQDTGDG